MQGTSLTDEQSNWVVTVKAMETLDFALIEEGAIRLGVEFILPRPRKFSKWKRAHAEPRCSGGLDLGNLTKALEGALNGVVWRDDAMISEYGPFHLRRYARMGERAGALVRVQALGLWYPQAPGASESYLGCRAR